MNKEVTVKNKNREAFEMAMRLIALDSLTYDKEAKDRIFRCNGYSITDGILFLSSYSDKCTLFPYRFNLQQTIDFAWGWWEANQNPKEPEPDTDGSTDIAFELTSNESVIGYDNYGFFACLKPIWFVYGK